MAATKREVAKMEYTKKEALAEHLAVCDIKQIGENTFQNNGVDTYLVLTDDQVDTLFNKLANEHIDDYIVCDLEDRYTSYFDRDGFIKGLLEDDRRAEIIGAIDELEHCIEGYYIYWIN